jgi:hypothetical protein
MNVEIGAEAALFPEKEYISGIFVAVQAVTGRLVENLMVKSGSEKLRFSLSIPNAFSTKMRKKVVDMDRGLRNRSEETRVYRP